MNQSQTGFKEVRIPLSRWHKVVERLHHLAVALEAKVKKSLMGLTCKAFLGESQIQGFAKIIEEGKEALRFLQEVEEVRAAVRKEVAHKNMDLGISDLLTQIDCHNRRVKFLRELLPTQHSHRVPLDQVAETFALAGSGGPQASFQFITPTEYNPEEYRVTSGVDVKAFSDEELGKLHKDLEALTTLVYDLQDQVAELNLGKVAINIPEKVWNALGSGIPEPQKKPRGC